MIKYLGLAINTAACESPTVTIKSKGRARRIVKPGRYIGVKRLRTRDVAVYV